LCQTIVDSAKISFVKSIVALQELELTLCEQFATNLFTICMEEGEKDLTQAIEEFEKSNVKFQHLDHKVVSIKMWVGGLVQHIQLMAHGDGIMTFPLPIDNHVALDNLFHFL
jgi:hypothetical protein